MISSDSKCECVVLVGLPAAGKSTLYRERFAKTHRHISKDLTPNVRNRTARQREMIAAALAARVSCVVDNTNATRAERAAIVSQAKASGARVICYFLDVPVREAVGRNRAREGKARVPDVAIFAVAKKLEKPSMDEGFDQLIIPSSC